MLSDSVNVVAAILGAALGLLLVFRLNLFGGPGEDRSPVRAELTRATGYVSTHQPSAAPILAALGATLLGVGLALASKFGEFSLVLAILGVVLLVAALLTTVRRRSTPPDH